MPVFLGSTSTPDQARGVNTVRLRKVLRYCHTDTPVL